MKTPYKLSLLAVFLFLFCVAAEDGCEDRRIDTPMKIQTLNETRFTVTRVGVFSDDMAYANKRGIYLIVDTATKKEYLGVSGIGISDLGVHKNGKDDVKDER